MQVFEGLWDEIVKNENLFRGKRIRVEIFEEKTESSQPSNEGSFEVGSDDGEINEVRTS